MRPIENTDAKKLVVSFQTEIDILSIGRLYKQKRMVTLKSIPQQPKKIPHKQKKKKGGGA